MIHRAVLRPRKYRITSLLITHMARSRRSPDNNPSRIFSLPPWWAFVILAGVSFAVLHWLAQPIEPLKDPNKIADFLGQSLIRAVALLGQYVIPLALLFIGLLVASRAARNRGNAPRIDPGIGDISAADAESSTGDILELNEAQHSSRFMTKKPKLYRAVVVRFL